MVNKRLDKSELHWADSDYLCLFCYDPLYYNVKSKKEICANPNCVMYQKQPRIFPYDPNSPGVRKFKDDYQQAAVKCYQFTREFLFNRLYEIRVKACADFFTQNNLVLNQLLGINYLIVSVARNVSWGSSTDVQLCDQIINECLCRYNDLKFVEEVELRIFLIDEYSEPYTMKYYDEIVEIRKVLGIVNKNRNTPEDVNSFYFLEKQARVGNPSSPFDFETIFKNHFGLVITTNHLFKLGYFISKVHQYPAKTVDLAVLFSLWPICKPTQLCFIDQNGLKEIYDGVVQKNNLTGNFPEFLDNYASGNNFAPILIHDGTRFHFDYFTLFIFMFYVFSLNRTIEGTQTLSGFKTLNDQRKIAAKRFELLIREKFRNEGYIIYPQDDSDLIITVGNKTHEYDCIAVDHSAKLVVLAEAKYEDIAPSSTAGETIVEQAILDGHDGSLIHAKDQHERRGFFTRNCEKFPCGIKQFWDYKITSVVITKHTPMINKHLTTHFMSYEKFKSFDFRQ